MTAVVHYGFLYPVGVGTVGPDSDSFWPLRLTRHFSVVINVKAANSN
jgi:hypothetical protein